MVGGWIRLIDLCLGNGMGIVLAFHLWESTHDSHHACLVNHLWTFRSRFAMISWVWNGLFIGFGLKVPFFLVSPKSTAERKTGGRLPATCR